jgi:protein-glutamine gamma-glutamyltransferase
VRPEETTPLVLVKASISAAAVLLFLAPLATPPGLVAGVVGTLAGYLLAHLAVRRGLRVSAGVVLGALAAGAGHVLGQWILARSPAGGATASLRLADAVFFGLLGLGLFFALRLLSSRVRAFAVVELGVVVAAVAHTFADHRHNHIHQPRFFSDWAWSHGVDPQLILAGFGVAAVVLAAVLLLDTRRAAKVLLTLLLLIGGGVAAFLLFQNARIPPDPDTNDLGLTKAEKDGSGKDPDKDKDKDGAGGDSGGARGQGGGSDQSSSRPRPPDPVAVAVLHDDLAEDADILYFRQAVLSRFAVDRLVEDSSGRFDRDVIASFPGGQPARAESSQSPDLHVPFHTSVYLLVDHAQLFGLGQPFAMRPLENPDPRRFVGAYDVDSWLLDQPLPRLVGRTALPPAWPDEERRHYLELPADPRYQELSDRLVRDVDPRFVGDDLMKAVAIKRYLEKNGFYSIRQKALVGADPAGKFLFGEMRGYCVHFAHAATLLLRSQGIPARVALGYAVKTAAHGAGTSILILGSDAHAWPELYLDGVGWVTFDIYPERSDEPPPIPIDQDLESLLGELARKDKTGGKAADPGARLVIPWRQMGLGLLVVVGGALFLAYAVKGARRARRSSHALVYRGVLDRLSDLGAPRGPGETRERHAARLLAVAPTFSVLTHHHLRAALGHAQNGAALPAMRALAAETRAEIARNTPRPRRLWAAINPIGWWFTR